MSNHGRHVWFDLLTTDTEAAAAFYTKLLGLGTAKWEGGSPQMPPYTMFQVKGDSIGGTMSLPGEAKEMGVPPHWLGYVSCPDVDAAVAKTESLGGRVLNPAMDLPNVGRFATLQDPQGAIFAAFAPVDEPSAPSTPRNGEVSWVELMSTDHEAGMSFYIEVFGWQKTEAMDMGDGWMYQMFGVGGNTMGGAMTKKADMPGPSAWLYYRKVDSVAASIALAKELGGSLVNGPMEVPGGDFVAQLQDPQGAFFAVHGAA